MMGAKAVNLVPGDRPGDVYTCAPRARRRMRRSRTYASAWDGRLTV